MKLRDEVAEFEASAVRDLMAILTGPASNETDCSFSPSPGEKELKREDSFEESEEYDATPPAPQQHVCLPTSHTDQSMVALTLPIVAAVEKPVSYFAANRCPPSGLDIASHLMEPPAYNAARIDERRPANPRIQDLFADPYDCSLGTPIFNDPNAEISHQPPEPRVRNGDNAGMVFGFDFEENVWSWLDQVP